MKFSGSFLVLVIVGLAVIFGAATWWRYTTDNPTSTDATLFRLDGRWVVEASFPASQKLDFGVGTGAIISSASFPGLRMTGRVATIRADDSITIALDHAPPDDAPAVTAPAEITIDAVTSPRE
jgi:hypothetical protein